MTWLIYGAGIATGVLGYLGYDYYFSKVYQLGKDLLARAEGNFEKAYNHLRKLV